MWKSTPASLVLVKYNVSDVAGNVASEVVRTVIRKTTGAGTRYYGSGHHFACPASLTIQISEVYADVGATASDDIDGDVTDNNSHW